MFKLKMCALLMGGFLILSSCENRPEKFNEIKTLQERVGTGTGNAHSGQYIVTLSPKSQFLNGTTVALSGEALPMMMDCAQNGGVLKCSIDADGDTLDFKGPIQSDGTFHLSYLVQDAVPELRELGLDDTDLPAGATAAFAFIFEGKFNGNTASGKFRVDLKARKSQEKARAMILGDFDLKEDNS